jgi:hypothetical protein
MDAESVFQLFGDTYRIDETSALDSFLISSLPKLGFRSGMAYVRRCYVTENVFFDSVVTSYSLEYALHDKSTANRLYITPFVTNYAVKDLDKLRQKNQKQFSATTKRVIWSKVLSNSVYPVFGPAYKSDRSLRVKDAHAIAAFNKALQVLAHALIHAYKNDKVEAQTYTPEREYINNHLDAVINAENTPQSELARKVFTQFELRDRIYDDIQFSLLERNEIYEGRYIVPEYGRARSTANQEKALKEATKTGFVATTYVDKMMRELKDAGYRSEDNVLRDKIIKLLNDEFLYSKGTPPTPNPNADPFVQRYLDLLL